MFIHIKNHDDKRPEPHGARTPQIVHPTSYLVHRQTPSAPAPSFLMVLTSVGTYAYRRDDGVLVVPLSTLRP